MGGSYALARRGGDDVSGDRRGARARADPYGRGMHAASTALAPVDDADRLDAPDLLRGVAVLGVLVMNVRNFALPLRAFDDPAFPHGFSWGDLLAWFLGGLVFEDKMIALFSALFGAGIVLFDARATARGASSRGPFWRRHAALLAIGLLHAYALWYGDILNTYALCAPLVFLLRRRSARTLLLVGAAVFAVAVVFRQWPALYRDHVGPALLGPLHARTKPPLSEAAAYAGGYVDQFRWRAWLNWYWHFDGGLGFNFWRCGGLMCVGAGLMKLGVLAGRASRAAAVRFALFGYGIGLPATLYVLHETLAARPPLAARFGLASWGGPDAAVGQLAAVAVAAGHLGALLLWRAHGGAAALRARLAACGRMALTNYLSQSVVCALVFDGWAGGRWGTWGHAAQLGLVAAVWGAQLAWSPAWLARFRYGPCEWVWRAATYGRRPPFRRPSAA
jgi:uncharacterized protein